jgi:hypothetical protein
MTCSNRLSPACYCLFNSAVRHRLSRLPNYTVISGMFNMRPWGRVRTGKRRNVHGKRCVSAGARIGQSEAKPAAEGQTLWRRYEYSCPDRFFTVAFRATASSAPFESIRQRPQHQKHWAQPMMPLVLSEIQTARDTANSFCQEQPIYGTPSIAIISLCTHLQPS